MKSRKLSLCNKILGCLIFSVGLVFYMNVQLPEVGVIAEASEMWTIDQSSAWWDRGSHTCGAGVTDNDSGTYFTVAYHLEQVDSSRYNVMESKNQGPWTQIGVIDWSYMSSADIGSPETGGRLFARVANVCARKYGYEKMF